MASVNTGTKKQKDKVTTVTPTTTGIGESSLTTSTGSSDNITEKNSDSGETATNKTYGNNQGDNYAVDIFTDKAVENKTKKLVKQRRMVKQRSRKKIRLKRKRRKTASRIKMIQTVMTDGQIFIKTVKNNNEIERIKK